MGGLAVLGNVFAPMIATTLYEVTPRAPYGMSLAVTAIALGIVLAHPRMRALPG